MTVESVCAASLVDLTPGSGAAGAAVTYVVAGCTVGGYPAPRGVGSVALYAAPAQTCQVPRVRSVASM